MGKKVIKIKVHIKYNLQTLADIIVINPLECCTKFIINICMYIVWVKNSFDHRLSKHTLTGMLKIGFNSN